MIELPDDELDKLFRKSAEELDPQFEPEDWNVLKRRLDDKDGKSPAGWLRKWWPLGLLLLMIPVGIISYYSLNSGNEKQAKGRTGTVSALPGHPSQKPEKGDEKAKIQKPESIRTKEVEVLPDNETATGNEDVVSSRVAARESKVSKPVNSLPVFGKMNRKEKDNSITVIEKGDRIPESSSVSDLKAVSKGGTLLPRSLSKAGGVYLEPNRSKGEGGDGALSFEVTEKVRKTDPSGTNAAKLGARQAIGSNGVEEVEEQERLVISASNLRNKPLKSDRNMAYPEVNSSVQDTVADEETAEKTEIEKPEKAEPGESPKWAVRLGYSPDLSSVGFKNLTKPGTAISLLADYGVSKRLYLQTGVIFSVKDYYANAGEYELKKYVTAINTPFAVDGTCTMIEVPIGIRYDITQNAHSRWFAGTGFSSYYAQKEKYKYYYENYVHLQKPGWQGKTGWFLLSHVNASVGYERTINRKLSILAEPYIRIPLKGVGYGKVNLITTGMWLSLRYTPAFR